MLALRTASGRWLKGGEQGFPCLPRVTSPHLRCAVGERVTVLLEARLRERDKLQTERSRRFVALGRSLAENEDELPIIAMLLDDYYQQMLHSPVPQPGDEPASYQPPPREQPSDRSKRRSGGRSRRR